MNIFYEEDGAFKVGAILADNTTSLQVESTHGKRSKIKGANVLLRFAQPGLAEFMAQAEGIASEMDTEFLWECSPADEFGFDALASEYFGHAPNPIEAAGTLLRLHSSPMHFYKKGKGHYKAAPPDALKSALASAEKKRQLAALQARYTEELSGFALPPEFTDKLPQLLYKPDRNTPEAKALEAACAATHLSAAHLLQRCGAIPSTQDYHLQRFLFEHFPQGTGFPEVAVDAHPELPLAEDVAFSIDDATTTEIDDAFSVRQLANGNWRIGVHIAAPTLGIAPGSKGDAVAAQRLSTVYMPGGKITMLPESVVQAFTLSADNVCPSLSMYLEVDAATLAVIATESRIERIHIAANLRHDTLEPLFNEATLAAEKLDYPFAPELALLWKLAQKLEAVRGKSADNSTQQNDYNFHVEDDRITISTRQRGSPIDKVVAELMIFVNSEWGKLLANHNVAGIYRTQSGGKVKMSTAPAPHQGLGVAQYLWSSSPLRRYVDFVNQRQIVSLLRGEAPLYTQNDTALFTVMSDFDSAYTIYNDFQRNMERYWCLRWLLQEKASLVALSPTLSRDAGEGANESLCELRVDALVLRENLVRFAAIPLIGRISSLPELPPNTRVILEIGEIDLLDLNFNARFISAIEEVANSPALIKQPLSAAMVFSLALHAVVLFGIGFVLPDPRKAADFLQPLQVVLVNSKSQIRPTKADALAQHNLDGGGNTPENRRAKTPMPNLRDDKQFTPEQSSQRVQQLEQESKRLLTQLKSTHSVEQEKNLQQQQESERLHGEDLVQRSLEIARLEAEIHKNLDTYQKMPRRKFIGARTQEFRFAQYVEDWRIKVERIGNLNYPETARQQRIYGSLQLTVSIRADGNVESVEVSRSSGQRILDAAAQRIVKLASPFSPFPPDISRDTDILSITRTWTFTQTDKLESE